MKRHSLSCLLFISFALAHHASGQDMCDTFVENNTLTVNASTAEDIDALATSFQDVVNCLRSGGTIRFVTDSFFAKETIRIKKNVSIASAGEEKTILECNARPVFEIRKAAVVDISDIAIEKCKLNNTDAPLVVRPDAAVTVRSSRFLHNVNDGGASSIKAMTGSSVTIEDSEFGDNRGALGTVVLDNASRLVVTRSAFIDNSATNSERGGGVFLIQSEETPTTMVVGGETRFIRNRAVNGSGGVIFISGPGASITLEGDVLFKANVAGRRGGAVFVSEATRMTIRNAFFVDNVAEGGGGALFVEDLREEGVSIEISKSTIARNRASGYGASGGGIYIRGRGVRCALTASVTFTMNSAHLDGGGMHISDQASTTIRQATFIGNEAMNGGGAALFVLSLERTRASTLDVSVVDTEFLFNRALYNRRGGGCIAVVGFGSNVTISDCNFKDNDGGRGAGGALYAFRGPVVRIERSRFERNKAEWGGALYAEHDASFDIKSTAFVDNSADEGGAVDVWGDVDAAINDCTFKKNRAVTEGGAVKMRNFASADVGLARFRMKNSHVLENEAGTNLFEDRLYGIETQGGGILAEGSGIELELKNNRFRKNLASNGGALSIYAVSDCNIDRNNKFEFNEATFGGSIFLAVDENVHPTRRKEYRVANSLFQQNRAEVEGGAIYVTTTRTESNSISLNTQRFLVLVERSSFQNNTARHGGGALSVIGSAVKVQEDRFEANAARVNSTRQTNLFLGYGGAVHVQTGSVVECKNSWFVSNKADVGGAVFVEDGSFMGELVNFVSNAAFEGGVGGAAAVEVSKGINIPYLAEANSRRVFLQCDQCVFNHNNGSLAGGALHVRDMDPSSTFEKNNDLKIEGCELAKKEKFRSDEHELTCQTYWEFQRQVNSRAVRFTNTTFSQNMARAGGAIFTNNLTMITIVPNVKDNLTENVIYELDYVLTKNETKHLEACNVSFHKNRVLESGYGKNVASTPSTALLVNRDDKGQPESTFTNSSFLSGDRLRFDVEFRDGLGEPVTFSDNLTARITCDEEKSKKESVDCAKLEISGQETAQASGNGTMNFTAVRLRGLKNRTYTLRIDYRSTSELQTLNVDPSFIRVTMRKCKIGERTVSQEGDHLECQECGQGEFQPFPDRQECASCNEAENHTICDGQTIVPRDGYWHASSFSFVAQECIGHDACRSSKKEEKTRTERLREMTREAHERGEFLLYNFSHNSTLCRKGYKGVLCGSCNNSYGREGSVCRECASPAMRTFLLMMLIFWSFLFLSYFIRSVLLLATRIQFNKRFSQARTVQIRQRAANSPPSTSQPAAESASKQKPIADLEMGWRLNANEMKKQSGSARNMSENGNSTDIERLNGLRSSTKEQSQKDGVPNVKRRRFRKGGRLTQKLQTLLNPNNSADNIEPLTLANPISEILKILVNFLQVTSVAISINVDWEHSLRRMFYAMGAAGNLSSGTGYLSLDCFLNENGHPKSLRRLTIAILYPLLMFVVYIFMWVSYSLIRRRGKSYCGQRILLTFLAINYFIYIGMTRNLLRFFACTHVGDDREGAEWQRFVWEEDTEVECYEGLHALLVRVLVVPFLLAVSFGFPVGILITLRRNKSRLNDEDFVKTFGFLYRAYQRYYWEVIIMIRKAVIAAIAVFAYRLGSVLQGLMCVLVIVIALCLHLAAQPFTQEIPQLNHLETCSLATTIIVFVAGLMMNDENVKLGDRVALSVIAILFVCFTLLVILVQLVFATEEFIDMKLIEVKAMEIQEVIDAHLYEKVNALLQHYTATAIRSGRALREVLRMRPRRRGEGEVTQDSSFQRVD